MRKRKYKTKTNKTNGLKLLLIIAILSSTYIAPKAKENKQHYSEKLEVTEEQVRAKINASINSDFIKEMNVRINKVNVQSSGNRNSLFEGEVNVDGGFDFIIEIPEAEARLIEYSILNMQPFSKNEITHEEGVYKIYGGGKVEINSRYLTKYENGRDYIKFDRTNVKWSILNPEIGYYFSLKYAAIRCGILPNNLIKEKYLTGSGNSNWTYYNYKWYTHVPNINDFTYTSIQANAKIKIWGMGGVANLNLTLEIDP